MPKKTVLPLELIAEAEKIYIFSGGKVANKLGFFLTQKPEIPKVNMLTILSRYSGNNTQGYLFRTLLNIYDDVFCENS